LNLFCVQITPFGDERYIVDWYCRIYISNDDLVKQLKDKFNAVENARVGMMEQELLGLLSDDEDFLSDEERVLDPEPEPEPSQTPKDPNIGSVKQSSVWE